MSVSMTERAKGAILDRCITASREGKRKAFFNEANQILQFAARSHRDPENPDYDKEEYWGAKVTKTSEARQLIGNAIYQQNPAVAAEMKAADPAAKAEAETMVAYLTTAMRETNAERQRKRAVDQAVVYGRGVLHTVLDEDGRVTSRWFSVRDYLQDPDALCAEDVRYKGRRRYSQRSELMRRFPKAKEQIAALTEIGRTKGDSDAATAKKYGDEREWEHDPCDVIEWYTLYFRVGLHNFRGGLRKDSYKEPATSDAAIDGETPEEAELDDGAKRYVVARSGGTMVILDEGPWEIPFWRAKLWPFSPLDLVDDDDGDWPVSPLSPGLPWEKAISDITQRALAKTNFNLRDIVVILQNQGVKFSDQDIQRIVAGADVEVICPEAIAQDASIDKTLKHFQFEQISVEFERVLGLCERYYEKATGVSELIYSGQGSGQFRNAAAANMAAEAATSRVDEFRQRVELWAQDIARKEAWAARVLLDQEDIAKVVGPMKAQAWRTLLPPLEEHAAQLQAMEPDLAENTEMLAAVLAQDRQNGVEADEWKYEWNVTIVAGSTQRASPQKQTQLAEWLMNQPFSAALSAGQVPLAMSMLEVAMAAHQAPPELIEKVRMSMLPPAPPEAPAAAPAGPSQ